MTRSKEQIPFPTLTSLPGFADCFQQANRDYTQAAKIWLSYRLEPLLLTAGQSNNERAQENIENACVNAVTTQFGPDTLTDHALTRILPLLERGFPFVIFSQGDPTVQRAKIAGFSQISGLAIPEDNILTAESKFSLIDQLSTRYLREGLKRNNHIPHLLYIEDKFTNTFKFLTHLANDQNFTLPPEEELDREDFDFASFEEHCLSFLGRNPDLLFNMSFFYVRPDKPLGNNPVLHQSALREERTKRLIASINNLYRDKFRDGREIDKGPFFHIDNYYEADVLPLHTFVVCDYDGPIGSQYRTLASRDPLLSETLKTGVNEEYPRVYGLVVRDMYTFLNDSQAKDIYIDRQGNISSTLSDRMIIMITKTAMPGTTPTIYHLRLDDRRYPPGNVSYAPISLDNFNRVYNSLFTEDNILTSAPDDSNS